MIRIRREPLEFGGILRSVEDPSCGAVAAFAGVVREENEGKSVEAVRYEAYESMAVRKLEQIAETLRKECGVRRVAIAHRVGELRVGETSVILAVSSPHRAEAFEAVRRGMDLLKSTVPIWKHETYTDGSSVWVGAPPGPA